MSVEGTWDLSISTPIGTFKTVADLKSRGGTLTGIARGAGEEVTLRDIAVDGDQLTWT